MGDIAGGDMNRFFPFFLIFCSIIFGFSNPLLAQSGGTVLVSHAHLAPIRVEPESLANFLGGLSPDISLTTDNSGGCTLILHGQPPVQYAGTFRGYDADTALNGNEGYCSLNISGLLCSVSVRRVGSCLKPDVTLLCQIPGQVYMKYRGVGDAYDLLYYVCEDDDPAFPERWPYPVDAEHDPQQNREAPSFRNE